MGPTGVGKTAVALSLAKKINAQIISCDSMQIYRKMDILTAKASAKQRKVIRHHLLNILDPNLEYNVAQYRALALKICDKLYAQDKVPLFVGGTGLYYSVLVDGLFPVISVGKKIRQELEKLLETKKSGYLYRRLVKADPEAAQKIHPHDGRRIVRALEVYLQTGKPISFWQKQRQGLGPEYEVKIFGLNLKRSQLYARIDLRVKKMFRLGLVNEVRKLLKLNLSKTATCAIGIPELKGYLNKEYDLAQAQRLIQRNSRHYAKRQLTWFKKDKRIKWININHCDSALEVAQKIWKKLS